MSTMSRQAIIVQARTGSTRLPGKMIKDFHQGKSLLEIILRKLPSNVDVILATTTSDVDTALCDIAERLGVKVYRGSEENVLSRFIEAAELFNVQTIVRVCADNPFLNIELLERLLTEYNGEDYLSYRLPNGKPTILGHLGIFCEVTSLSALKVVAESTSDKLYLEHVTNYLYTHPNNFTIRLMDLPSDLVDFEDLRLTVDTEEDFKITSELYARFGDVSRLEDAIELVKYIGSNSVILSAMQNEIKNNSK